MHALEDFVRQTKLPVAESGAERSISRVIIDMENYVRTSVEDPPLSTSGLHISMNSELGAIMDEKLKTAMSLTEATPSKDTWWISVLESKAIQEVGPMVDSKQYKQLNKKLKDALEQVRPTPRHTLDAIDKLAEEEVMSTKQGGTSDKCEDAIIAVMEHRTGNSSTADILRTLNVDMWALPSAKAEGEAEEKLESCNQGEGLWAYLRIPVWFTRNTDQ